MTRARIAAVSYLNTAPLIEGLEKLADVELSPCVPSRIVNELCEGRADVGLASIIDSVHAPTPLTLLPVGMIGCDGPTLTVRLFSKVPLSGIGELHADLDSHTSVVLAQVLLWRLHGLRPCMKGFDAARAAVGTGGDAARWPESVLLIGDKVVTDAPPADGWPHQLDLGEAWKSLTGLPFVYAMWMCRRGEEGTAAVRLATEVLDRQRRHNATRLDWIVSKRAAAAGWPASLAQEYLGRLLRYQVGVRERAAVATFLESARELGLTDGRSVEWADEPARVTTA
jgi:chorismate dehydratase